MQRLQAFKFELRPNGKQERDMRRFAGACRFVFNKALDLQQRRYAEGHKKLNYAELCKALTAWRREPEIAWLAEAPIHPLQQSLNKNIVDEWDGDQKVQARQVLLSFLSQGVDPNAVLDVPVSRSTTARTSMLHLAIQAVQTDLVKLLLNHGADPMLKVHALDEQVHAKGRGKNAPSVLALEQRRASAQKTANPHAEWPPNRQELLKNHAAHSPTTARGHDVPEGEAVAFGRGSSGL